MTVDVGARLQAVRKLKGLSQRELAKRVGVTNSTISLIEQNRVSPSVGSLKKVLDGIPMSMAEFFAADEEQPRHSPFYGEEDQPNLGQKGIDYFLVGAGQPDRSIEVLREIMQPGSDTGEDRIRHSGDEGGVVVSGQLELTVGEETQLLGPNEGYYFQGSTPHRFRSVGDQPLVIVSANTSPRSRGESAK
ncbi:cupin domain-containing protein [Oceanicoccus sagamiensis]|uniref:XRE family transcriptional regulator n=1 Tax=Oceanicoccus sagamiensis TaxID=716816 RepID=A0A1X9N5V9_9GAMM|nr:cupin domain-containing protein [Oceanicoccus sagamiensis]ARN73480.1 XRE family transcriptional regulator [Oceanicoccus sagamiensis]